MILSSTCPWPCPCSITPLDVSTDIRSLSPHTLAHSGTLRWGVPAKAWSRPRSGGRDSGKSLDLADSSSGSVGAVCGFTEEEVRRLKPLLQRLLERTLEFLDPYMRRTAVEAIAVGLASALRFFSNSLMFFLTLVR